MHALVTGATGFIGANLVKRLIDEKWQVRALARRESSLSRLNNFATSLESTKRTKITFGDLSDLSSLKRATQGIDIVFNCAAALPYHLLKDEEYWKINVEGVRNLLGVCEVSQVKRVIHISTVGIYGPTPKKGASEQSTPLLDSIYSKTKFEGEQVAWDYIKNERLPLVIIKPTIGYGPGDTRPGFLSLFRLLKKRIFIPVGDGENYFHTIFIDNLVDALILAATEKAAVGEDFIIGDDPCPKMRDVVDTIATVEKVQRLPFYIPRSLALVLGLFFDFSKTLKLPAPLTTQRIKFITESKRFKIDKARKILGYKPKTSLLEGITRTFKWYQDNGYI